jgi:ribosome-associated protein
MSVHFDQDQPEGSASPQPSKSQRKREASALQNLGEKLVTLTPAQLHRMPLPEALRDAVLAAQNIIGRSAGRRQRQLIGKLMRQIDPDPIRAALDRLQAGHAEATRRHHYLERLCEGLLAGDESRLSELIERYPAVERQRVRQLARNASREAARGKPPASRRALFRYLREICEDVN